MAEQEDKGSLEQADEWMQKYGNGNQPPKELFRQVNHVAILLTYDLIDKLRYWETETLKLPDDQVDQRLSHMATFIGQLKTAYVTFADVDL